MYINRFKIVLALISLSFLLSFQVNKADGKPMIHDLDKNQYVAGEYIITLEQGVGKEFIQKYFSDYEVVSIKPLKNIGKNVYLMKVRRDPGFAEIQRKCKEAPGKIKHIQPNYIYRMSENTL